MDGNLIFTGPPLKLATRTELVEELCGRRDVLYQTGRNEDGESDFLTRHSFEDKAALARSPWLVVDALEGRERETTFRPPGYRVN